MNDNAPTIHAIKHRNGVAGQYVITADVSYPDEPRRSVVFVGSHYGGPVVMQSGALETFVSDPNRFGKFGEVWVRAFFAAA